MITGTKVDTIKFKAVCDFCEKMGFSDVQFEENEYKKHSFEKALDDDVFYSRARDRFKLYLYEKRWLLHQDSTYLRCPRCQLERNRVYLIPWSIEKALLKLMFNEAHCIFVDMAYASRGFVNIPRPIDYTQIDYTQFEENEYLKYPTSGNVETVFMAPINVLGLDLFVGVMEDGRIVVSGISRDMLFD